jgi:hypothetical protein
MTSSEREYQEKLERRIQELERSRVSRFTPPLLLVIPFAAMAVLSASTPSTTFSALESRLFILESAIRVGPDGAVQSRGPFQVLDAGGRVLFSVGSPAGGAVTVTRRPGLGGAFIAVTDDGGKDRALMMVNSSNHGRIMTYDGAGQISAMLNEAGLNVHDPAGKLVAGVTRGRDGLGRVVVFHNETQTATELTSDAKGNGRVVSYSAAGKMRSAMFGETGVKVFDDAEMDVVSLLNRNSRGVVGVKNGSVTTHLAELTVDSLGGGLLHMKAANGLTAIGLLGSQRVIALGNSAGKNVAEIAVDAAGGGVFQVWGNGKVPLAVLGKSNVQPGGIVQVSNGNAVTSSFTVGDAGNGYWQLNDAAGNPLVEAGVTPDKRGTVRVGPMLECAPQKTVMGFTRVFDCIRGRVTP